jgi:cell division protein ZapD
MTSRDSKPGTSAARGAAAGPVYEQPLNERMRTFLRLDFLYQQALFHEEREDSWSTRAAVGSLLEILAITARGDVRSEVLKELERQMAVMNDYQARPGVDTGRLRAVLSNLERLRTELNSAGALCATRSSSTPSNIAARFPAALASSTCPTIATGSSNRSRYARRISASG